MKVGPESSPQIISTAEFLIVTTASPHVQRRGKERGVRNLRDTFVDLILPKPVLQFRPVVYNPFNPFFSSMCL